MWMRLTRTSVTPSRKQPKRLSHVGIKTTIFRAGMRSVNPSVEHSCSFLMKTTRVWLLKLCLLAKLTGILNNLTGRSRHSLRHCPVLADAIASQPVRRDTRLLSASQLDLSFKKCLTFGGPQRQT